VASVKKLGFNLEEENYFSPQFSPYGSQQSILNVLTKRRDLLYEHLKGNVEYVKGYSKLMLLSQKVFHWLSFPLFVFTDLIASFFKKGGTVRFVFRKDI
jgi:hypothetical protein